MRPNVPTQQLSLALRSVASTLHSSATELLSIAVRLAADGNDRDALRIIAVVQHLNDVEDVVSNQRKDADIGKIVRLSCH